MNLHAAYAAGCVQRVTGDVAIVEHADAVKRGNALENPPFEEAAALAEKIHFASKAGIPGAEVEPPQIAAHVDKISSARDKIRQQFGKVVIDDAFALLQKHVHVPYLRQAFAEAGPHGEAGSRSMSVTELKCSLRARVASSPIMLPPMTIADPPRGDELCGELLELFYPVHYESGWRSRTRFGTGA
jgi:hypothetical protein